MEVIYHQFLPRLCNTSKNTITRIFSCAIIRKELFWGLVSRIAQVFQEVWMAEVPKFCEQCGMALSPGAKFCSRCGKTVILPSEEPPISLTVVEPEAEKAPIVRLVEPEPAPVVRLVEQEPPPAPKMPDLPPNSPLKVIGEEAPRPQPRLGEVMVQPPVFTFTPLAVIKALFLTMFNPRQVMDNLLPPVTTPIALCISGLAFLLFFLQTGMDMHNLGKTIGLSLMGLGYGVFGVSCIAAIAWLCCRPFGNHKTVFWAAGAFGLSFSPALIYLVIGLIFNVFFGWNTALVFGVTGVLWSLPGMITAIQEMLPNRTLASIILATLCCSVLIFGWTWLGAAV
jgi:hypothetical protein